MQNSFEMLNEYVNAPSGTWYKAVLRHRFYSQTQQWKQAAAASRNTDKLWSKINGNA